MLPATRARQRGWLSDAGIGADVARWRRRGAVGVGQALDARLSRYRLTSRCGRAALRRNLHRSWCPTLQSAQAPETQVSLLAHPTVIVGYLQACACSATHPERSKSSILPGLCKPGRERCCIEFQRMRRFRQCRRWLGHRFQRGRRRCLLCHRFARREAAPAAPLRRVRRCQLVPPLLVATHCVLLVSSGVCRKSRRGDRGRRAVGSCRSWIAGPDPRRTSR